MLVTNPILNNIRFNFKYNSEDKLLWTTCYTNKVLERLEKCPTMV